MKNKIYLTRHGQDEDNAEGILNGRRNRSLTELGRRQAEECACKIKDSGITFDIILTSPLQRTLQTAEIIAKMIGATELRHEPLLIEREFGIMTGQPIASILELCCPDVLETGHINYFLSPEGAETFPELMARGRTLLSKLKDDFSNKSVLLVTHGDIGKMIYASYYNQSWEEVLRSFHFGNSELLLLSQDSPAGQTHIFNIQQYNV